MAKEKHNSNSPEQCIICGTIIEDLAEDDVVQIDSGKLCYGCFNEGWFKKCEICDKYIFESEAEFDEEKDQYLCKQCIKKKGES